MKTWTSYNNMVLISTTEHIKTK